MILPIFVPVELEYVTTPLYVQQLSHIVVNACVISNFIEGLVVFSNIIDFFLWQDGDADVEAVYLMMLFFTILTLFNMLAILATIRLSASLMFLAWLTWLFALIMWLSEICVLFSAWSSYKSLCIGCRCPENLWLSDFYFRAFEVVEDNSEPANGTKIILKKDFLFLTLSILTFLMFLFYFSMLGSIAWNMFWCLKLLRPYLNLPALVPPTGYVFILPFRV